MLKNVKNSVVLAGSLVLLTGCTNWLAGEVMNTGDLNGDGIITLQEWNAAYDAKEEKNSTKAENMQTFIEIDVNGDRKVTRAEVDYFLTEPTK